MDGEKERQDGDGIVGGSASVRKPLNMDLSLFLTSPLFRLLVILLSLMAFILAWTRVSAWPRTSVYVLAREMERRRWQDLTAGWSELSRGRVVVRYTPQDADMAPLVLKVTEEVYRQVAADIGGEAPGQVQINIFPDGDSLRQSFPGGQEKQAMGVYWAGYINILSPRVWAPVSTPAELEAYFRKNGPLAHELTHLVFDFRTGGNYPHWFSEGLAQYEEYRLTGFLWIEPQNRLDQRLYTLAELDQKFDGLENEALAYRQAFLFVSYLEECYGPGSVRQLIDHLAAGRPFHPALAQLTGRSFSELQADWSRWLNDLRKAEAGKERAGSENLQGNGFQLKGK